MFMVSIVQIKLTFDVGNLTLDDLIVLNSIGRGSKTTADIRRGCDIDGREQWLCIDRLKDADLVDGDFECSSYFNLTLTERGKTVFEKALR